MSGESTAAAQTTYQSMGFADRINARYVAPQAKQPSSQHAMDLMTIARLVIRCSTCA